MELTVQPHPLLEIGAFVTRFARPLAELVTPSGLVQLLEPSAVTPLVSSDTVRGEVRQLLRHGGFRPSGRSKPASGYLHAAHAEKRFPRINAAVDACNVASLWSGLPISLVDVDRLQGSLTVDVLAMGTSYLLRPHADHALDRVGHASAARPHARDHRVVSRAGRADLRRGRRGRGDYLMTSGSPRWWRTRASLTSSMPVAPKPSRIDFARCAASLSSQCTDSSMPPPETNDS